MRNSLDAPTAHSSFPIQMQRINAGLHHPRRFEMTFLSFIQQLPVTFLERRTHTTWQTQVAQLPDDGRHELRTYEEHRPYGCSFDKSQQQFFWDCGNYTAMVVFCWQRRRPDQWATLFWWMSRWSSSIRRQSRPVMWLESAFTRAMLFEAIR